MHNMHVVSLHHLVFVVSAYQYATEYNSGSSYVNV